MIKRGKKFLTALGALCVLAVCVAWWMGPEQVLVLRDVQGHEVFTTPLPQDGVFGIRFTHSVALSPVEEWFHADDGVIALDRTVYQDFGAGLPHETAPGQRMTVRDGYIEISGYTLRLQRMDVRVGRVAGHVLLLPPGRTDKTAVRELPLSALAPPGAALSFTVEKADLRQMLLHLKNILP